MIPTGSSTSTWPLSTEACSLRRPPQIGLVRFGAFTMEELKDGVAHLKRGKAVGSDLTSAELIFGLMEVQGGPGHLLEWYNRILATGLIPACWNEPILVMLPKVKAPRAAKDLRPIAVGSAVCKLFSRLLLNRSIALLSPQSHAQCAGPGRQTSDFLYTIIRLFELSREWGNPLIIFKLDLEKAFDSLDRRVLLQKLEAKIGPSAELRCWCNLLRDTMHRHPPSPLGQLTRPHDSWHQTGRRGVSGLLCLCGRTGPPGHDWPE